MKKRFEVEIEDTCCMPNENEVYRALKEHFRYTLNFKVKELPQPIINHFPELEEEVRANARLIAQSPKMYEVCKYLVKHGWNAGVTEMAKEVIAEIEEKL